MTDDETARRQLEESWGDLFDITLADRSTARWQAWAKTPDRHLIDADSPVELNRLIQAEHDRGLLRREE